MREDEGEAIKKKAKREYQEMLNWTMNCISLLYGGWLL